MRRRIRLSFDPSQILAAPSFLLPLIHIFLLPASPVHHPLTEGKHSPHASTTPMPPSNPLRVPCWAAEGSPSTGRRGAAPWRTHGRTVRRPPLPERWRTGPMAPAGWLPVQPRPVPVSLQGACRLDDCLVHISSDVPKARPGAGTVGVACARVATGRERELRRARRLGWVWRDRIPDGRARGRPTMGTEAPTGS